MPIDLVGPLEAGEVRAGRITDVGALIGGLAAEGRVGDYKLYNDRVAFIVQGPREGDYYVPEGGMVVDADIVRPEGMPGRDVIDELGAMLGVGRMIAPDGFEVLSNGQSMEPAVLRVTGTDSALALIEGSVEAPGLVPELGLKVVTDFVLRPDSWTLEVHTTVTATDTEASFRPGDAVFVGPEAADKWSEGSGMQAPGPGGRRWTGYVGNRNDIAVAVLAAPGQTHDSSGAQLLTELAEVGLGFGAEVVLAPGESASFTRSYGVGPDMATLTDATLAAHATATTTLDGVVTAPDGPVAGARVMVEVDGAPFTVAFTGEDGAWSAEVPEGSSATARAVGRLTGRTLDLPEGAAPVGPYSGGPARELGLGALAAGAPAVPFAEGRGIASEADPMVLAEPALLEVHAADGLPFEVRVRFQGADPVGLVDERLVHDRPSGNAAAAWSRDGDVVLPVEPGTYELLVQRGMRWELHQQTIELVAGQNTRVDVDLGPPIEHAGWLLGDPHSHASPSGDGELTMEARLLVHAGNGVQLHFGTDHDHVADYRPTVDALGLTGMWSIVADEVSPVLRGHMNAYPLEPQPALANHGAVAWWSEWFETTRALTDALRERHGPEIIVQSNHPLDSGLFSSADWEPGRIDSPDRWSDDIQAIEVLNSGDLEGLAPYFDLVNRGHRIAAVGVTDSHGHFSGGPGRNGTWLSLGDDPRAVTNQALIDAVRAEQTIATRGAFLSVSEVPGSTLSGATTLAVEARSPSWIVIDRLLLLRNGEEVDRIDGVTGSFDLQWAEDCVYHVVAEGDQAMAPLSGDRPWAMTGAYRYDAAGDGWTAPLPPLEIAP